MNKFFILLVTAFLLFSCGTDSKEQAVQAIKDAQEYLTPFENGNGNQTATYEEVIAFYKKLAADFASIQLEEIGLTDSGKPLHLISFSKKSIDWSSANEDKIKILINNGIHPGESDGIDASLMLLRDLATGKVNAPDNLIFSAIAIYNVGGSLNRNTSTRTNQNGPESYGFRGNARNYDLNRDFIKADSRNALAFYKIYHKINPDIFIDNHVSNGADYQYTLTHLFTQHNKLGNAAGDYLHSKLQPELENRLAARDLAITPYVNVFNSSPENGFSQFMDYPRYSTGYTSLWNTLGMMVETHMLKPYKDRVLGTQAIMEEMIVIGSENVSEIKQARADSFTAYKAATSYALNYSIDNSIADTLNFLGYEAVIGKNELTGNNLMTYDRNQPFTKKTAYQNYFKAIDSVSIPDYYVVPQSQWKIIELMRHNHIQMELLPKDTTLNVTKYRIANYKTATSAYEGHYPHSNVQVEEEVIVLGFRESDIIIPTRQPGIRYIIETLEPAGQDSFFKWNYFDTILQQKEGFSSYVFESTAQKILSEDNDLKKEFDSLKIANKDFRESNYQQLDWIHKRSPNYEKAHLTYPIYKWNKK
ncbi:M14 family metallopeptidase [Nonlabens sp.]|uniref:M14 family metallopeptidase n=1 Tax=Nonlabens sp. TaxID=1888209 RepID=UPI001BCDBD08|nr:M14 family metallopeptidase [Nonlabens sp.]